MIRALIIDDEPLARLRIQRFLKAHKDVTVLRECTDGASAVSAILEDQPNLIFLDMHLPELNGLEVVTAVGEKRMPEIIVITAHEQYALDAFEASAIDYLLKPFGRQRFDKSINKARKRLNGDVAPYSSERLRRALEQIGDALAYRDRISVYSNGRILLVNVLDIQWIEAEGNYARLHTKKGVFDVRETLTTLEQTLDPAVFTRIHRSSLVNIKKVREIHPWFNGYHLVVLEDGHQLRMSRYQHESAKRLLGK